MTSQAWYKYYSSISKEEVISPMNATVYTRTLQRRYTRFLHEFTDRYIPCTVTRSKAILQLDVRPCFIYIRSLLPHNNNRDRSSVTLFPAATRESSYTSDVRVVTSAGNQPQHTSFLTRTHSDSEAIGNGKSKSKQMCTCTRTSKQNKLIRCFMTPDEIKNSKFICFPTKRNHN